jgi:TetR/AcrR family transcriptional regulator, mexJK operon transcriptional repressor
MRTKTEARRQSFIHAAGELFLRDGFANVTMEAIASKSRSSKVTLYNYFPTKELLFEAWVIEAGKDAFNKMATITRTDMRREAGALLYDLSISYLSLITQPEVIALQRLIIGEAERFPELARIFYNNGPKNTMIYISGVLSELVEAQYLTCDNLMEMTVNFKALCEGGVLERQLWGIESLPLEKNRLHDSAERAVSTFMAVYRKSE